MFGKIFGKSKKDKEPAKNTGPSERELKAERYRAGLPTAKRKLLELSGELPNGQLISYAISNGDDAELKKTLQNMVLPLVDDEMRARLMRLGDDDAWASVDDIRKSDFIHPIFVRDCINLGAVELSETIKDAALQFTGDGHLLTVAMTGAGKGQCHVLPNLLNYTGSTIVLDPKGEGYEATVWQRAIYGKVFKWAPFDEHSDSFNPLDFVDGFDDARMVADLVVVPENEVGDRFWDRSARDLLTGLILFVSRSPDPALKTMREVTRLLSPSEDEFNAFIRALKADDDDLLVELANQIESLEEKLRASIMQTLRSYLDVWRSPEITRVTAATHEDWDIESFRTMTEMEEMMAENDEDYNIGGVIYHDPDTREVVQVERGSARTAYIVLPPHLIKSYAPVLRVILGLHIKKLLAMPQPEYEPREHPSRPVLFLLDELPQLGYMRIIEEAAPIARSAKIRLWLIAQDLSQFSKVYPQWETIISACKVQCFFSTNDLTTASYVAARIGTVKSLWGEEGPAASPQDLMGDMFKNEQIIFSPGMKPIRSQLIWLNKDPTLMQRMEGKKALAEFTANIVHAPRTPEALPNSRQIDETSTAKHPNAPPTF